LALQRDGLTTPVALLAADPPALDVILSDAVRREAAVSACRDLIEEGEATDDTLPMPRPPSA